MNAKRDTEERAELSSLLPAPAQPELSADRHQLLRGHLMSEISGTSGISRAPQPVRGRGRRYGWVALPALAGGLALTVVLGGGGGGTPSGPPVAQAPQASRTAQLDVAPVAAVLLDHAAQAAEKRSDTKVGKGQFTYVMSVEAYGSSNEATGETTLGAPHRREIWLSADGQQWGLLIDGSRPAATGEKKKVNDTRPGIPAPRADGGEWLEPNRTPGLNGPTYEYLAGLPTDPAALLEKIYRETKGHGNSADQEAFVTIGDLLRGQIAPPAVSAALYRAAARIPGVTTADDVADASGRTGVVVAHVDEDVRTEWIFDRSSYELLGEREVVATGGSRWGTPGTVIGQSTVLGRGVVDTAGDRPKQ